MVCVNAPIDILQDEALSSNVSNTMSFYPAPIDRCNKLSESIVIAHFPLNALIIHFSFAKTTKSTGYCVGSTIASGILLLRKVFSDRHDWLMEIIITISILNWVLCSVWNLGLPQGMRCNLGFSVSTFNGVNLFICVQQICTKSFICVTCLLRSPHKLLIEITGKLECGLKSHALR